MGFVMMIYSRHLGLGAKLSLITGTAVAVLFLLFTRILSQKVSKQLESLATDGLQNQTTCVMDMVEVFNASLIKEVETFSRLFDSFLPYPFSRDTHQTHTINGETVPLLKGGNIELHNNNIFSD